MSFVDTHCHIHSNDYPLPPDAVIEAATQAGVNKLICVGTSANDSKRAVDFVQNRLGCWATVGVHPHDAKEGMASLKVLDDLASKPKVVAIGECGLDYYYNHSPKRDQEKAFRYHIELALTNNLPLVFHVRDAFSDFWRILDEYQGLRGVIHSFSATQAELDQILARKLFVGLNGIMTFTKREDQRQAARGVPLKSLILETDAPYLTPVPERGNVNQPKNVVLTANFLADIRGESVKKMAEMTTKNADKCVVRHI